MVELIKDVLAREQYRQIKSNIPYVNLYVIYENSSARVVQLINCEKDTKLTVAQFDVFCERAESFIRQKGYEQVDFLSIVISSDMLEAKKLITGNRKCWVIDALNISLVIYENQPGDFGGLRKNIEDKLVTIGGRPISYKYSSDISLSSGNYNTAQRNLYRYYSEASSGDNYSDGNYRNNNLRSLNRDFTLINTALVLINVIVFFVMSCLGSTEDTGFMLKHGAMFVPSIVEGKEYYRLITCMFMHFGFTHLAGNMIVMLFLGDNVERAVGKVKYIIIYFGGGLAGSLGSFLYASIYNKMIVSAGASGAIFALIGALLWVVVSNRGKLENMTTLRICVLIAYSLYNGFMSENVDMAAHIFGLFGGFVLAVLLYRKPQSSL